MGGGAADPLASREDVRAAIPPGTNAYPTDWSPDGRYLLFQADQQDVWRLPRSERTLEPVLVGQNNDWGAAVSPDGRAVAFVSDASGRRETYVARWPTLEERTAVSADSAVRSLTPGARNPTIAVLPD